MEITEDYYRVRIDTVSQNTCNYLWATVSKRKAVQNTKYKGEWNRNCYQRTIFTLPNMLHRLCVKETVVNRLLLIIAFKRNGCFRNRHIRIIVTKKVSQKFL